MTTSPLKADSRAQFEAWVKRINPNADLSVMEEGIDKGEYVDGYHAGLFAAWTASRAAIVVELPDYTGDVDDELSCFDGEYEWGNRAGATYAVTQCAAAIRAAGITIRED
ncbi:hypothetical protein [Buttiauxella noackiae]|uniref:hypothetical protein n=1 Tax=Buttiauxella noackiae TaxID=82992 RepID=UPI0028D760B1|nr:hypothetical protein [Buttiauxella noackiae]